MDRTHRLGGLLIDSGRKSLSVYQRLRGQILATAAAYVGLHQAANLVKSAVTVDQKRQSIGIQLKIANNDDAVRAARDLKFLRDEADRLGLVFNDLAGYFANYKISAKSAGLTNLQVDKSFIEIAESVTALRLTTSDSDRVFRAFTQILGKNRVTAEELRGQLGDALPGAVTEFAKSLVRLGKIDTISGLDDYLKKGKADLNDLLAFTTDYNKKFQAGLVEGSQTLFAHLNRLRNIYDDFLVTLSRSDLSGELLKSVKELKTALSGAEGQKFAKNLGEGFATLIRFARFFIIHLEETLAVLKIIAFFMGVKGAFNLALPFIRGLTAINKWTLGVVAARTAGASLSVALGAAGLLGVLGPLAIAIGVAAGAWYVFGKNARDAAASSQDALNTLGRLKLARGAAAIDEVRATAPQLRAISKREDEIKRHIDNKLNFKTDKSASFSEFFADPKGVVKRAATEVADYAVGVDVLRANLKELGANRDTIMAGNRLALANFYKDLDSAAKLRAQDKAEVSSISAPTDDADDAKAKKGPSEKSLRAEANAKLDAARAINKELLDLDQQLFDAQIDGQIKTAAQIAKNYELTVKKVESEIEEQRLTLEKLEQTARAANNGNLPEQEAKNLVIAREKLELLNLELHTLALKKAELQDIELLEQRISAEIEARDAKIAAVNQLREVGFLNEVEARKQIGEIQLSYEGRIKTAITELVALLQAKRDLETDPAILAALDAQIAKYGQMAVEAGKLPTSLDLAKKKLAGDFATGAANAFVALGKGIAGAIQGINSVGDAFKSAKDAFLNFLADFLIGIAQAILQAILLEAIMAAIEKRPANFRGASVGALTGHTGGVVKSGSIGTNPMRQVPAAMFAGAQRFHGGGLPGLAAGEVPAILRKREEVLTADDPRNVLNGGTAQPQQGNMDVSIINTIDSGSVFEA
ncbi:MAG: tape measure protein, partial [Pseudomonadota bacterium]|nr:tape measure protein [Pseudomonadota bacterium]